MQVSFIGYPATSGLAQMDYRITDVHLDPPGQSEAFNSEELIRLRHNINEPEFASAIVNALRPLVGRPGTRRKVAR